MGSTRFEVEKFTGDDDFGLWKMKMRALLVQQCLIDALKVEEPEEAEANVVPVAAAAPVVVAHPERTATEKQVLNEKAHSAIILCLGDKVLRKVSHETTASGLWKKLEELYMTKSLANRLYLKHASYSFKMQEDKAIEEQVDHFNKLILDLENLEVKMSDEDQALLLVCALPRTYSNFKETLLYGRDALTLNEVQSALYSKQLNTKIETKNQSGAETLMVRGRSEKKEGKKGKRSRSKSKTKVIKCYHCHEEGHVP